MVEKKEGSAFRSWLIERLSTSRFSVYRDDTAESIARRIGVQVDVLHEARALTLAQAVKPDHAGARVGIPRAVSHSRFHVHLEPPEAVFRDWRSQCTQRAQTNACLLRSVVHHVLRLKVQPHWLSSRRRAWYYQGTWQAQDNIRAHRFRFKTDLNAPCHRALIERALATGVSSSSIVRWGVVAFLEGKFRNFTIVSSLDSLYNSEDRYCTKPEIVQETING